MAKERWLFKLAANAVATHKYSKLPLNICSPKSDNIYVT